MALNLCPLACLVSIPFFLCRPTFEGLQRGRPGLVMAILRHAVLTTPLALAGMMAARRLGQPVLYGLILGLIVASAIASSVFLGWTRRVLADLGRRDFEAGHRVSGQAAVFDISAEPDQGGMGHAP